MTFAEFWLTFLLNRMGWPQTKGLLIRKKFVSSVALWGGLVSLVRVGIALGALRPKIAVSLLADTCSRRDWSRKPATESWAQLDPSEQIANNLDKQPEEVIAEEDCPWDFLISPDISEETLKDVIAWKSTLIHPFYTYYHMIFVRGIIWGLSHPEEALSRYEEQRQKHLKNLPDMLSHGLDVYPPETFEEFADAIEESVNAFQDEIRPFAKVPQELLSLPAIATRLNSI